MKQYFQFGAHLWDEFQDPVVPGKSLGLVPRLTMQPRD